MTVPVGGSPDFQGALPWKSDNIFNGPSVSYPVGTTPTPVLPSLSFSAIQIRFVPATGQARLALHWYADAAGTIDLGQDLWYVNATNFVIVAMPTEGPYFSIHVANSGAAAFTADNWAMLTNEPVTRPTYPVTTSAIYGTAVSVPAASSIHVSFGRYTKGRAHWRLLPADALGKLNAAIEATDEASVIRGTLITSLAFTTEQSIEFTYPDDNLRMTVTNTDGAAAHVLDYALAVADDV